MQRHQKPCGGRCHERHGNALIQDLLDALAHHQGSVYPRVVFTSLLWAWDEGRGGWVPNPVTAIRSTRSRKKTAQPVVTAQAA